MYKQTLMIILALAQIVCMSSVVPVVPTVTEFPSPQATLGNVRLYATAVGPATFVPIATPGSVCFVVTADQSLHVRADHIVTSRVIGWLVTGDQVRGVGEAVDGWQLVVGKVTGWVNARYLAVCDE